jgi:predicted DNA-binding protein
MIRTSIYLDNECYQYLHLQSHQLGKTISELVRELIHVTMSKDVQKILDATNRIYGLWENRQFNVEEYIREMRQDRTYGHD